MPPLTWRIALVSLILLGSCTAASPPLTQNKVGADHLSAARFEEDMTFLASDALEGRKAGTRGYQKAAAYVAASFEDMGLTPAGDDNSYFQEVPLGRNISILQKSSFHIHGQDPFFVQRDFVPLPSPTEEEITATGDLVYMGGGIDAPQFGYTAYQDIDVQGKIVVITDEVLKDMPPEEAAHLRNKRTKYDTAARHGAVGVVTLSASHLPKIFSPLPDEEDLKPLNNIVLHPEGHYQTIDAAVRLTADGTEKLLKATNLDWESVWAGVATPQPLGITATLTTATKFETYRSPNVIGMVEGSDPVLKHEYVVLSAHLDHIGMKETPSRHQDLIYNGAIDNATGVATLMEAARKLMDAPKRPRRSVIFIALTAEEIGLLGSEYFAFTPSITRGEIVANVNLDMPILLYEFTDVIAFGMDHSNLGAIVEEATSNMGITLTPDPVPHMSLFVRSDHYSFVKAGIPSVFLFLGWENGGEDVFNNFLNTHYHKPSDETDLPLNYAAAARFSALNYHIVYAIANSVERPQWKETSFFSQPLVKPNPADP